MIFGLYCIGQLIQQKRVFVLGAKSLRFISRKLVTRFRRNTAINRKDFISMIAVFEFYLPTYSIHENVVSIIM